jgi:aspartyl/asparaginyl-tRNA synthetase
VRASCLRGAARRRRPISRLRYCNPVRWSVDLQSEHEHYLTEKYARKPVIVMNYPKAIKAFYMRLNDDGRTVAAMDVLAPGIGEIIGGSQREERLDVLDRTMAERVIDREHYAWWHRQLGSCRLDGKRDRLSEARRYA